MKASIVVPVYNCKPYLHRCLSSIAAQTHSDLEVILVDDGARDGSGVICDSWAREDPRFRVLHQENRGPGAARNAGMDAASGRYLFFFDGDDAAEETLVETVLRRFEKTGAEVVVYGCCHVSPAGKMTAHPLRAPKEWFSGREIQEDLLPGLFTYRFGAGVSSWGKGYDLEFLRRNGIRFPEKRNVACEDGLFMLTLFSEVSRAALENRCLYHYYRRTDSLSRKWEADRQHRNDAFLSACLSMDLPEKTLVHIQSRYHGMTLGTMAQCMKSDRTWKEKRTDLRGLYCGLLLGQTLQPEILALDAALPRLFWRCLRRQQFYLCDLLLIANQYRSGRRRRE